jgi:hypothetical protein
VSIRNDYSRIVLQTASGPIEGVYFQYLYVQSVFCHCDCRRTGDRSRKDLSHRFHFIHVSGSNTGTCINVARLLANLLNE